MRVSVFGLGYVGAVTASCLARDGHSVIGVETNATKVGLINTGRSPIIEEQIEGLIASARRERLLRATSCAREAVEATELSLICVGTPSEANGNLHLGFVSRVCEEIGEAMRAQRRRHCVVLRSTVLPGTTRAVVIPALERASGKRHGRDFDVCFHPEFLREGTAVADFDNPPKTVIGELEGRAGDALLKIYRKSPWPLIRTTFEAAEMAKYVDNTWHALKVGFANEIGSICKAMHLDSFAVMDIFCRDTTLNISSRYLRPGFAFGGSCLPKDVRALKYRAKTLDVETPLINSILPSNDAHILRGIELVLGHASRRVGVLGFSFKTGTDDLRGSPVVELIERLIGKGYDVLVYDRDVSLGRLTGTNLDHIRGRVPHIARLMRDSIEEVVRHAETIVIGNASPEFERVPDLIGPGQVVVDLVRIASAHRDGDSYEGICW